MFGFKKPTPDTIRASDNSILFNGTAFGKANLSNELGERQSPRNY